jgi:hypothetical protein
MKGNQITMNQQRAEDLEDIKDAKARTNEESLSFDELIAQFQSEGLL